MSSPFIDLFVYGTLKRGYANFAAHCGHALEVVPASVPGWLYHLPHGYPGAVIPQERILAEGSDDPEADAALQWRHDPPASPAPVSGYDRIQGEIMRLPEPRRSLPPVDRLEDFRADGRGMYRRALVLADPDPSSGSGPASGPRPVWMYWMPEIPAGRYLRRGVWPEG
ncbi:MULTISPECIES: gamma-glutamylcyclotransferase [unclassified Thioalkalivibrio]|uniref:gamma-glutamylcyclotransferase family protein n=1 Tax=unclassified Thioalkalivibrio TaxID=2621013 RepID=UPI000378B77D|nr:MULTISPECIES: gamma-glutamylcyclotransferase family protein [unclassified Thioalkalivibrio]